MTIAKSTTVLLLLVALSQYVQAGTWLSFTDGNISASQRRPTSISSSAMSYPQLEQADPLEALLNNCNQNYILRATRSRKSDALQLCKALLQVAARR